MSEESGATWVPPACQLCEYDGENPSEPWEKYGILICSHCAYVRDNRSRKG